MGVPTCVKWMPSWKIFVRSLDRLQSRELVSPSLFAGVNHLLFQLFAAFHKISVVSMDNTSLPDLVVRGRIQYYCVVYNK